MRVRASVSGFATTADRNRHAIKGTNQQFQSPWVRIGPVEHGHVSQHDHVQQHAERGRQIRGCRGARKGEVAADDKIVAWQKTTVHSQVGQECAPCLPAQCDMPHGDIKNQEVAIKSPTTTMKNPTTTMTLRTKIRCASFYAPPWRSPSSCLVCLPHLLHGKHCTQSEHGALSLSHTHRTHAHTHTRTHAHTRAYKHPHTHTLMVPDAAWRNIRQGVVAFPIRACTHQRDQRTSSARHKHLNDFFRHQRQGRPQLRVVAWQEGRDPARVTFIKEHALRKKTASAYQNDGASRSALDWNESR